VKLKEKVNEILKGISADIVTADDWGNRRLAYEINKATEGYYYFVKFSADPLKVQSLKKELHQVEAILRYMILVDEHQHVFRKEETAPTKSAPAVESES
jgi:small subunit ribosomal protein S6